MGWDEKERRKRGERETRVIKNSWHLFPLSFRNPHSTSLLAFFLLYRCAYCPLEETENRESVGSRTEKKEEERSKDSYL